MENAEKRFEKYASTTKLWTFEICHFSQQGAPRNDLNFAPFLNDITIIPPFAHAGFDPKIMIFPSNRRAAVKFASPPVSTSLFGGAVMAKVGQLWFWRTLFFSIKKSCTLRVLFSLEKAQRLDFGVAWAEAKETFGGSAESV